MKAASILALIGCLATVTEPKIYPRCKLAKMLLRAGMDNFQGFRFENWICMAYCESRYNTTAQKVLKDGSTDYGIFQINSYTWCRRAELEGMNFCHVACSDLLTDDLTDAIICAKKIAHETEGMNYWFRETYSDLRKTAAADQTRLHSEVQQWCQRGWSTPFSTRV